MLTVVGALLLTQLLFVAVGFFDVHPQQLIGVELAVAERTDCGFSGDAHVGAEVHPQVVLVFVSTRTKMALEGTGVRVDWQVLVVLRLEQECLITVLTFVDALLPIGIFLSRRAI